MNRRSEMTRAAREGRLRVHGARTLLVSDTLVLAVIDAFAVQGAGGEVAARWERAGRNWGEAWYAALKVETSTYGCGPEDLDLDDLLWLVSEEVARGGWGRLSFDLDTHADAGIILGTVRGGPASDRHESGASEVAELLAGFIAGVLGRVSEVPMVGVGVCRTVAGVTLAALAAAHPSRSAALRKELEDGIGWTEALSRAGAGGR